MVTATVPRRKGPVAFGRKTVTAALPVHPAGLADDLRLFATFFLGGLTFMTVYLA